MAPKILLGWNAGLGMRSWFVGFKYIWIQDMDLILNVFVRINPSSHYFGQKLSSDLFILDSHICGDEMVLEFMKPRCVFRIPAAVGWSHQHLRKALTNDAPSTSTTSPKSYSVRLNSLPRYIPMRCHSSSNMWMTVAVGTRTLPSPEAARKSPENCSMPRVGEIHVFFAVEGNWDRYT